MLTHEQIVAVVVAGVGPLLPDDTTQAELRDAAAQIADAIMLELEPDESEDWRLGMQVVLVGEQGLADRMVGRVQQRRVTDGELHTLMVAWPGQSSLSPHSPAELVPA